MGKLRIGLIAALVVVAVSLGFSQLASAQTFRSGNSVTVGQAEVVEGTLYASGQTVDISSQVNGDIFCAGQTVTISGRVSGDVICAAQTLNISGQVLGDVRLAGQTVTIGGAVDGNATIGAQSFVLEADATVGGDATGFVADANVNGKVGRDVVVYSENLLVAGTVGRNIKTESTNLSLSGDARVGGDINLTSFNDIDRAQGAVVEGEVNRTEPARETSTKRGAVFGFSLLWFLYWFAAMLLTALAIALVFPSLLQAASNRAMPTPWKALLVGFMVNFFMPLVVVILGITLIGLPLAILLGLAWLVLLFLSGPFSAYYLGRLLLRDSRQPLLIMLAGASLLLVIYFIPIIGFLALIAAAWIGMGMLLLELYDRTPRPVYNLPPSHDRRADTRKK